ncbi:MAG: T9SS type A sorting domain-containing protein, partial [Bacteroidetes bacterium]|nr:T9SS type A sorting domain-containing protein [Bacteroidota bacterium]
STNLGQNWTDISGNLPEFPVNDIVLDPDVPNRIIVGTDAGVYGTIDGGQYWYWLWTGNPAVPVCAMKIHTPTRKIVAGTYGLSMFSANLDELFTGIREENKQTRLHITVFPNPVRDHSVIRFYLHKEDHITLSVVNQQGQEIGTIFSGKCRQGEQQIPLHSASFRSTAKGIYHIMLRGERTTGSSRVLFLNE